jgi:hypothetical protein
LKTKREYIVSISVLLLFLLLGCRQQMTDQPRYESFEASSFFDDHRSARPLPLGTVPRGELYSPSFVTGKSNEVLLIDFPISLTQGDLVKGRDRYNINCAPCHDQTGRGQGMVVQRGFRGPPSFHLDRLREAPAGHFVDVMNQGFGAMPSYSEISATDRWRIVAYIRALQLSQRATLEDAPSEERRTLENED